jgi:hypothetical protein
MRPTLRTTAVFVTLVPALGCAALAAAATVPPVRRRIRLLILLATVVAATLVPPVGRATGGRYAFAGGRPRRQGGAR